MLEGFVKEFFEGFVEEEWPGRYGAVLAGQTYDFTTCDSVDYAHHTASRCASLTNGGGKCRPVRK